MRRIIFICFVLFLPLVCQENLEILYKQLEERFSQLDKENQPIKNIPKYKEITNTLEEIIEKKPTDKKLIESIYKLLIECYDRQAEYPKKHRILKEYSELLYPEEKEKQAKTIKEYADKLKEKGEITEAIILYRLIVKEYPDTKIGSESYFRLGKIFEEENDWRSSLIQYQLTIKKDTRNTLTEEVLPKLGNMYLKVNQNKEAIETFQSFISKYPESPFLEDVLYELGCAYFNSRDKQKAKETFELYLMKYPKGKYISETDIFLEILNK
ncbi:MAG: tetratricopeptide repeat protein [Candidatus Omnitrophica bacterium]|nr:tetratricopeptide repeat protein [Candidatus Omnitrophota bacterium]MCM8802280.1 tetratricopeptide repeat protein [Candidatus Omnitrophota bacterium]